MQGGAAYGDVMRPDKGGSQGGNGSTGSGGAGGGFMSITLTGVATINGKIMASIDISENY